MIRRAFLRRGRVSSFTAHALVYQQAADHRDVRHHSEKGLFSREEADPYRLTQCRIDSLQCSWCLQNITHSERNRTSLDHGSFAANVDHVSVTRGDTTHLLGETSRGETSRELREKQTRSWCVPWWHDTALSARHIAREEEEGHQSILVGEGEHKHHLPRHRRRGERSTIWSRSPSGDVRLSSTRRHKHVVPGVPVNKTERIERGVSMAWTKKNRTQNNTSPLRSVVVRQKQQSTKRNVDDAVDDGGGDEDNDGAGAVFPGCLNSDLRSDSMNRRDNRNKVHDDNIMISLVS